MEVFKLSLVFVITIVTPLPSSGQNCVWPKYFDLSKVKTSWKYGDQDRSWDTKIQIETSIITEVNGFIKSRTRVLILTNDSFQTIQEKGGQLSYHSQYQCEKKINDYTFIIKNVPIKEAPEENSASGNIHQTSFRCMSLTNRSRHVIQWKLGEKSADPLDDCPADVTDPEAGYDWPLIYFPVEDTDEDQDVVRHLEYLDEYPKCPTLTTKGYMMEVTSPDGSNVCSNSHPSPRLEIECSKGSGLRMLPSTSNHCKEYSFLGEMGAKMHCLGDWDDLTYKYIVLVPAGPEQIKSFHCLRINKADPTQEDAILFLDTICKSGEPDPGVNFFKIKLRSQKIEKMCDNYDDDCVDTKCADKYHKYACFGTCASSCPFNGETGKVDELVGEWIVQTRRSRDMIRIATDGMHLGELGKFKIYGTPNKTICMKAPAVLENAMSYSLASTNMANGCIPRVTQLRMKKITDSVALMQVLEPSPLRANMYASMPSSWCYNNLEESKAFSRLYHPYWPYISDSPHGKGSGWFTMVKKQENPVLSTCDLNKPQYEYTSANQVKLEFVSRSNKRYSCEGRAYSGGDNKYMIDYHKCVGNSTYGASIDFECLGSYQFNDKYQAVIARIPSVVSFQDELLLDDEYYCILFPSADNIKTLPVLVHTAGDCDAPNIQFVREHYRKSVLRMTYSQVVGGAINNYIRIEILLTSVLMTLFWLQCD